MKAHAGRALEASDCLLAGVSELIEDGKEPVRVQAGDAFVMKPD